MSTPGRSAPTKALVVAWLMAVFVVGWSVAEWLPTLLTPGYSLFQVVWVRYATHLLLLLIILGPRHGRALWATRSPRLQIGRGLLMLVMPASFILSLSRVQVGEVLAGFWLSPLWMLAFAVTVLRDRAPWPLWGAALASTLGALLILRPTAGVLAAAPFGLGMALSFSLYVVLTRALRTEPTAVNLFYSALAVFVPLTFVLPAVWRPIGLGDGLVMMAIGLVGLAVLWALDKACEHVSTHILAPLFALQLVLYTGLAPLAGGSWPGKLALAGAALIVGGASVALRAAARPEAPERAGVDPRLEVEAV